MRLGASASAEASEFTCVVPFWPEPRIEVSVETFLSRFAVAWVATGVGVRTL